jgi:predicted Zn-dependent protease
MQRAVFEGDPDWLDVLRGAAGCALFVEERQDATVEMDSRGGPPRIDLSRTSGMAVQLPDGLSRFRAGANPADVEALTGSAPERVSGRRWNVERDHESWLGADDAARVLQRLIDATLKLQSGIEIEARWVGFEQRVHVGHDGEIVADRRRGSRIHVRAGLARRGRRSEATAEAVLGPADSGGAEGAARRLSEEIAARVETRLAAASWTSGERRIVFAPGVGGVLLHEVDGHALEADAVLGQISWLGGAAADRSFAGPADLRVLDDPRRGRAPWRFDDEGQPSRATPLVGDGRAVGKLYDRATAARDGRQSTGHGRRSSFRDPVRPRMGCTFLAAGRHDPADALVGIEHGIYVRRMESASTDTRTGSAVFRVTDADRIQHGRLATPLSPHVIALDAADTLVGIDCVADNLVFDTCVGSCVHHGQPLSISVGSPTFRIGLTSVLF